MRFLNYKQKIEVIKVAKAKKEILYKNQKVHFYNNIATEVHKQHDVPAAGEPGPQTRHNNPGQTGDNLKGTKTQFNTPTEVQHFINKVKEEATGVNVEA